MEIILTYRGEIPSKRSSLPVIWDMRRSFHTQLEKLWGKEPFSILKKWEDSDFAAGAPNFRRHIGALDFVPFYGRTVGVGVDLEIVLLSGVNERKGIIESGDLDNRVKRIVDGLSAPTQQGEVLEGLTQKRWHCLLENDNAVMKISAELGPFLDSCNQKESFALIRVKPVALKVMQSNLGLLF